MKPLLHLLLSVAYFLNGAVLAIPIAPAGIADNKDIVKGTLAARDNLTIVSPALIGGSIQLIFGNLRGDVEGWHYWCILAGFWGKAVNIYDVGHDFLVISGPWMQSVPNNEHYSIDAPPYLPVGTNWPLPHGLINGNTQCTIVGVDGEQGQLRCSSPDNILGCDIYKDAQYNDGVIECPGNTNCRWHRAWTVDW